jgi:hypothetical protein
MLATIATGAIGMVLLAVGWVWIQQACRRAFPDATRDPDPLAGRIGCHGCESEENCGRRAAPVTAPDRKENS